MQLDGVILFLISPKRSV